HARERLLHARLGREQRVGRERERPLRRPPPGAHPELRAGLHALLDDHRLDQRDRPELHHVRGSDRLVVRSDPAGSRGRDLFVGYDFGSTTFTTSPSIVYSAKRATAASFPDSGVFLRHASNATTNVRWGDDEAVTFEGWNSHQLLIAAQYAG